MTWDDLTEDQKLAAAERGRLKLPARRNDVVRTLQHRQAFMGTLEWTIALGEYDPATRRFGEVFIDGAGDRAIKKSSTLGLMAHEGAILISIALQRGATIDELRTAMMRDDNGAPHSVLGAALDLMAEEVAG